MSDKMDREFVYRYWKELVSLRAEKGLHTLGSMPVVYYVKGSVDKELSGSYNPWTNQVIVYNSSPFTLVHELNHVFHRMFVLSSEGIQYILSTSYNDLWFEQESEELSVLVLRKMRERALAKQL